MEQGKESKTQAQDLVPRERLPCSIDLQKRRTPSGYEDGKGSIQDMLRKTPEGIPEKRGRTSLDQEHRKGFERELARPCGD